MEKVKLTKEMLDKVRHVEGFPIGRDEDIIALSDPPYYTACPNPFIDEFIKEYGKPYDEATDDYHREPFAADVTEGKNDPIYNAHSYHTKVPYKAIMRYILHYTEPGDIIFDGFCGTGMTGVAAQMCGQYDPVFKLEIEQEMGQVKWGSRKAILCDLSPAATFIAYNFNSPVDVAEFEREANRILEKVKIECGWMYETQHIIKGEVQKDFNGKPIIGRITSTIWSDVFICPQCSQEIVYWKVALEINTGKVKTEFSCPHCNAMLSKYNMERAKVTKYDKDINETIRQAKQVPVMIYYSIGKKRYEKEPDIYDYELLDKIENMDIPYWYPTNEMPDGHNTEQPKKSHGVTHVHKFYNRRSLYILSLCEKLSRENLLVSNNLKLLETGIAFPVSKMYRYTPNYEGGGPLTGTLYIPSICRETSALSALERYVNKIIKIPKAYMRKENSIVISTLDVAHMDMKTNSLDYIFTDPPFGDNIMYSELNFIWETWLKVISNNRFEAIINKKQNKDIYKYQLLMEKCFTQMYHVLKPGRWLTMVFHNSKNAVWNAIQEALLKAGFVVADVRVLNKKQGSFKQITTTSAMKEDLIVSAYKPKASFLTQFSLKAGTEDGVWEFIKQHLEQLPVVVTRGDLVEILAERQNNMLYDRMVAFHLESGYTIPMGAAEFYQGLHQRFPERDGMYFLPQQIPQYEQKRAMANGLGQLSLFVQDERTAIQWARAKLEEKRQTLADLTPQFLKEVNYVRWEKQLELSEILDQNFLQDEKGLWYVPDPNKQADLEKLREKALLREFEQYKEGKGKLKIFRTEAVRAGFKACWKNRDYQTIVKVGQRISEAVIQDDSSLLMYYNNALTRIED
ncbi:MAG: DNA methyltransferase [Syntrophomonadaceae bacterium]|nr:DNA methyltransferase [Syntrophomonadaceae bacterium]